MFLLGFLIGSHKGTGCTKGKKKINLSLQISMPWYNKNSNTLLFLAIQIKSTRFQVKLKDRLLNTMLNFTCAVMKINQVIQQAITVMTNREANPTKENHNVYREESSWGRNLLTQRNISTAPTTTGNTLSFRQNETYLKHVLEGRLIFSFNSLFVIKRCNSNIYDDH